MTKKIIKNGSLYFSLDYDLECEDFNLYEKVDGNDIEVDVSYEEVTDYLHKLIKEVKGFRVSQDRTEGTISFKGDNMDMSISVYTLPEENETDDYRIKNVPIIPFEIEME